MFTKNEKRAIVQSIILASNENQIERLTLLLIKTLEISSPREMEELWETRMSSFELIQNLRFESFPEKRKIYETLINAI